ncbi:PLASMODESMATA CALLOSE-BINDING PROTEIN 4-like [Salvia hispanica]|uniref:PLASMODESMATA CALLOSE-BINDING PROTEIN 4-like n=1 Tax=Salvia hispanica TaxID=49212 RepID=UPI00200982B7|nr:PLASMODESMATA CALLOSE-BINDING PROTEIN 4-like [Salvia hispanica]
MMAAFVFSFVIFSAFAASSVAAYCVCKSGLSDSVLQKTLDYACGNGADCSAILPTGRCFNPNTLQDHCSYAVNSYYQLKLQLGATCDFQGAAAPSQSAL